MDVVLKDASVYAGGVKSEHSPLQALPAEHLKGKGWGLGTWGGGEVHVGRLVWVATSDPVCLFSMKNDPFHRV